MSDDPLMPAFRRFPRDVFDLVGSDEQPSSMRPFILRGVEPGTILTAKHRTNATRVNHPQPTHKDGKDRPIVVQDDHFTPDD